MRFVDATLRGFVVFVLSGALAAQAPPVEGAPAAEPAPDSSASGAVLPARVEGVATVGDLARVHSQVMMAEAQRKLRDASGGGSAGADGDDGTETPASRESPAFASPVVVGIHGSAQAPYALVRVSDAAVVSVRRGDTLPGGLTVVGVGHDAVRVRGSDGERVLGFASAAPAPQAPSATRR